MRKLLMVLMTLSLLVVSAFPAFATELDVVCESGDALAENAAQTQCDFLGDPDENTILAQRHCTRFGKACINRNYDITQEDIEACETKVIELCSAYNEGAPQLRETVAEAREPAGLKEEPLLVPEEEEVVEVEIEVPAPEPTPVPESKGLGTTTIVIIVVALLALWYLISGKKKGSKKKKK